MEVIWQASDTVSIKNSMHNVCQKANSFFAPNLVKKIFKNSITPFCKLEHFKFNDN